jgi:hypothetical protein
MFFTILKIFGKTRTNEDLLKCNSACCTSCFYRWSREVINPTPFDITLFLPFLKECLNLHISQTDLVNVTRMLIFFIFLLCTFCTLRRWFCEIPYQKFKKNLKEIGSFRFYLTESPRINFLSQMKVLLTEVHK